ncbi:MAG: type VI secretion system tube protein Hcp [Pirellulales bacterium]
MIIVSFETLKSVTSSYVALEDYATAGGWFSAKNIDFGHGVNFRGGKTGDNGGPSLDLFVEKVEKNELTITKAVDEFTPYLMFKAATDRKLKSKAGEVVYISFLSVRAGQARSEAEGVRAWLKIAFGTCFLTEWKISGSEGSSGDAGVPEETLTITYNQVAMSYKTPHKPGTAASNPIERSVDLTKLGTQVSDTGVSWSDGEAKLRK